MENQLFIYRKNWQPYIKLIEFEGGIKSSS